MKDKTAIIDQTKKWVRDFVIHLNLCPFAKNPFDKDEIRYFSVEFEKVDDFINAFYSESQFLKDPGTTNMSTTLIIIPKGLEDFLFYLDILETCQGVLDRSGLDEHIQLASFHPDYQFEGTQKDDITNYTNRSPYPIIHLLKVSQVEKAIESHDHPEEIPVENQKRLREMGLEKLKDLSDL